jgi:arsenite methyltransferase
MAEDVLVDADALREQVREKYRQVALEPEAGFHFNTGRALAHRLGYEAAAVDGLPDRAVESFAGVGNPFALRRLWPGERVVDVGAGAGFDAFIAARQVGEAGRVVGVEMSRRCWRSPAPQPGCSGWGRSSSARVWRKPSRSTISGRTW